MERSSFPSCTVLAHLLDCKPAPTTSVQVDLVRPMWYSAFPDVSADPHRLEPPNREFSIHYKDFELEESYKHDRHSKVSLEERLCTSIGARNSANGPDGLDKTDTVTKDIFETILSLTT